ncbi:hypothetical protein [Komagataeibacter sp. FNDCR2]|uniref:hypothetical protein n=1 Tax=Komagataeibacter sp. FNDCR2 TaxID=2878682 RepID=UPI001E61C1C7|nr:hypothetical protein [Komagataeibacter sp. FNDCR2]MCE2576544.1 hypothetical protein [Komagataeibacter sp. FNDCR2]
MTWLETLINTEIIDRIAADPRTTADNFLGYPKQHVFADVLQGGRRIIEVPLSLETPAGEIVSLSVTDQALLYARYNQKGHLHELMHAFRQLIGTWRGEISILDIGCGPATGGLALASVVGPAQAFRYFGCDRSIAMLDLGGRLMAKARELDGIHRASEIRFVPCLNDVDFGNRRQVTTLGSGPINLLN